MGLAFQGADDSTAGQRSLVRKQPNTSLYPTVKTESPAKKARLQSKVISCLNFKDNRSFKFSTSGRIFEGIKKKLLKVICDVSVRKRKTKKLKV